MKSLKKHNKKVPLIIGFIAVLLIGLVVVVAFTDVKKSLPLPIAKVNGDYIMYNDYNVEKTGYEFFLKNSQNQELDSETVEKDVMSRLVFNRIMEDVLSEYSSEGVLQEEIDQTYLLATQGRSEAEFETLIMDSYGWSADKFKKRVIVPTLVQQKMVKHFKQDEELIKQYSTDALEFEASHIYLRLGETPAEKAEAKKLLNEVLVKVKAGESFEDFASTMNQDLTVGSQGSIGWFAQTAVAKEFGDVVAELNIGDISSEVVESSLGFHIIKKTGQRNVLDVDTYMNKRIEDSDIDTFWGFINPVEAVDEANKAAKQEQLDESDEEENDDESEEDTETKE